MRSFKERYSLSEARKGDGVVFTFGRFNPPHAGHELLVNTVLKTAKKHGYENMIFASPTEGNEKNPLKYKNKIKYMKDAFRNANVVDDSSMKNPFFVAKMLSDQGYKNVILVVGSDRVKDLDDQIRKYIDHPDPNKAFYFDHFEVVSAGGRDPDADDISGMSASKMRKLAAQNDFEGFANGAPSGMKDRTISMMFDDVRAVVPLEEEFFDSLPIDISEEDFMKEVKSRLDAQQISAIHRRYGISEEVEAADLPIFLVLTKFEDEDELSETADHIEEAVEEMGGKFYAVSITEAFITDTDVKDSGKLTIHNYNGEGKKLTIPIKNTVAIPRGSVLSNYAGSGLLEILEGVGVFCLNTKAAIEMCSNKYSTAIMLEKNRIPSPKTALVTNEDSVKIALEKIGGEFPVVVKTLTGAEGIGVSIVESEDSLMSVLQSLWKFDAELLLQEYMEIDFDVSSIVLDGKVLASMKRMKSGKGFRTNAALGNENEPYELNEEEIELVQKVAQLSGAYYCGVDHVVDEDGGYKILEVNTSPGSGAEGYTLYNRDGEVEGVVEGDDLVKKFVEYIADKSHWDNMNTIVGEIEWITIDGVGKMKCKSDSGNGYINAIHAENIDMDGLEVTFDTDNGKTLTKTIMGTKTIEIGSGHEEERPIVHFDISMGGRKYKDVPFTLADRSTNDHPVLLGKEFLIQAGFLIDVSKDHLLPEGTVPKFSEWINRTRRNG